MKHLSAGGVVWRKNNGQLEIKLIYTDRGFWTLPKGHIEEGERIEVAALREVKEESGVIAEVDVFVGDAEYNLSSGDTKVVSIYLMRLILDGEPNDPDGEAIKAEWKSIDEAMKLIDFKPLNMLLIHASTILINRTTDG